MTSYTLDELIDDIVNFIDYDIWKDAYNLETAEEPEFVEDNRNELKRCIEMYIEINYR